MSDFLGRLAARSLGVAPIAQPLGRSMFSPGSERASRFEQGPNLEENLTEAISGTSRPENDSAGHDRSSFVSSTRGMSDSSDRRNEPQTEFSVVVPRATSPSFTNAETPPFGDESYVARSLTKKISVANPGIANKDAENQAGEPRDSSNSSATDFLVAPANSPREPFPASSFVPAHRSNRDGHEIAVAAAPFVKVSIGRVEIRAEFPATTAKPSSQRSPSLALSLDEYARQRREGKR